MADTIASVGTQSPGAVQLVIFVLLTQQNPWSVSFSHLLAKSVLLQRINWTSQLKLFTQFTRAQALSFVQDLIQQARNRFRILRSAFVKIATHKVSRELCTSGAGGSLGQGLVDSLLSQLSPHFLDQFGRVSSCLKCKGAA